RCAVWVQSDKLSIVIDTGPEFRLQSIRSGIKRVDLLLLTHEHNDHVAGLDDLRPYNYHQQSAIPTYTTQSCIHSLLHRFHYMFGPDKVPGSVDLELHVLDASVEIQ